MPRDVALRLADVQRACELLQAWKATHDVDLILADANSQAVVERHLQNIGEALLHVRRERPDLATRVSECDRIIGMRHILVHGYFAIRPPLLREVLVDRLAVLRTEIDQLLFEVTHPEADAR